MSTEKVRVLHVAEDGAVTFARDIDGRMWTATVPGDGRVSIAEAAAIANVHRTTVYRWANPRTASRWGRRRDHHGRPLDLTESGDVALPELRRFVRSHGRWWRKNRGELLELVTTRGPVAPEPRGE